MLELMVLLNDLNLMLFVELLDQEQMYWDLLNGMHQ
jgi:hypothetical protein